MGTGPGGCPCALASSAVLIGVKLELLLPPPPPWSALDASIALLCVAAAVSAAAARCAALNEPARPSSGSPAAAALYDAERLARPRPARPDAMGPAPPGPGLLAVLPGKTVPGLRSEGVQGHLTCWPQQRDSGCKSTVLMHTLPTPRPPNTQSTYAGILQLTHLGVIGCETRTAGGPAGNIDGGGRTADTSREGSVAGRWRRPSGPSGCAANAACSAE